MVKLASPINLSFAQACAHLGLAPADLVALRDQGLVACLEQQGRQVYPQTALQLTDLLLALGRARGWTPATLAWYADLAFAAEVGRTILLPTTGPTTAAVPLGTSWLPTAYAAAVLHDLQQSPADTESLFTPLLRSLVTVAVGEGQFWPDRQALDQAALAPVIAQLEARGTAIVGQGAAIARDAGHIFMGILLAFTTIAPPISDELRDLVLTTQARLQGQPLLEVLVPTEEQTTISSEALIAVDKLYAARATEIHTPPSNWDVQVGVISAAKRTVTLQMHLPIDSPQDTIDNIIDLIRPYVGAYGARVVHLLYEIANDAPYWRNPLITIDTNDLLDRLGAKRDPRGIHRSKNRELLRNVLNVAHGLEIVGEYTTWEEGRAVRKAMRKTVLSLIGATFDGDESHSLSTEELFERGLPKSMQIRLNFYEGVRRTDGRLGNQYVLMPRLGDPKALPKANYAATHELLRAYLLFRYRQTGMKTRTLTVTRQTALEKTNIRNKNPRMATQTLRKALDRLVADGSLESFTAVLPAKPHESFVVVLAEKAVHSPAGEPALPLA
ncbi:MAG: hypothetical protein M3Z04_17815 [Chloroflexota bacterium]|nr:hypothetical protein [Chloroflexota bacterium]